VHLPLLVDKIQVQGEAVHGWNKKKTTQSPQVRAVFDIAYSQNLLRPTATLYHTCAKQQALEKKSRPLALTFEATGI
jgi:hypothetical protein